MRPDDIVPATALLETATGGLAAIEQAGVRSGPDGIVSPLTHVSVHVSKAGALPAAARLATMLAAARRRRILHNVALATSDIRDESWASSWKKYYKPIHIAPGLFIVPTWQRRFKAPRGAAEIRLDPGMAFGTGQHASTQLAINLLLPYVQRGTVVLDIGCGSGILALTAARAGARVYASDIDPIAVQATRDNFATNKLKAVKILRARGVPASFPKAQVIVANITARVLTHLAPAFVRKLTPGGILVTSGIIKGAGPRVLRELSALKLEHVETGGRSQLVIEDERPIVTGMWRAYVHRKRGRR